MIKKPAPHSPYNCFVHKRLERNEATVLIIQLFSSMSAEQAASALRKDSDPFVRAE